LEEILSLFIVDFQLIENSAFWIVNELSDFIKREAVKNRQGLPSFGTFCENKRSPAGNYAADLRNVGSRCKSLSHVCFLIKK